MIRFSESCCCGASPGPLAGPPIGSMVGSSGAQGEPQDRARTKRGKSMRDRHWANADIVWLALCALAPIGILRAGADAGDGFHAGAAASVPAKGRIPNVLFIAVDDLRPELGCYGVTHIRSPNIDRLASKGALFARAYCQQAVCGPSRASLMTGLRPDTIKGSGMTVHFRKFVPDVVTLPQHFKANGYFTRALGKIYHGAWKTAYVGDAMQDPPSWSAPLWSGSPRYYFSEEGVRVAREVFAKGPGKFTGGQGIDRTDPDAWTNHFVRGLATEAPEIPDELPYDGAMTVEAIRALNELKGQPFFLAVGYLKPHLPFVAPKRYWDLYDPEEISAPACPGLPTGAPKAALTQWEELRAYTDMPKKGDLGVGQARRLRHGYAACVSYVDAMIGRLLDELDRLGLRERTIVVLWGDHGFKLGDLGMWCKHTNYEYDTRVPLIVSAPGGREGVKCDALVELVDIYPTLCELAGIGMPAHLEGSSFAQLLNAPDRRLKVAAFSQYPRGEFMGYSMRTARHRLTVWQKRNDPGVIQSVELYDHEIDPGETTNVAAEPGNSDLVGLLRRQLGDGLRGARAGIAP